MYFNSGTWIRLIRIGERALADAAAFEPVWQAISSGRLADLDALAISETSARAHRSTVPGKMHACGHDGHTAMLLGAARRLAKKPDFAGTVPHRCWRLVR